jgi:hypothetical protein
MGLYLWYALHRRLYRLPRYPHDRSWRTVRNVGREAVGQELREPGGAGKLAPLGSVTRLRSKRSGLDRHTARCGKVSPPGARHPSRTGERRLFPAIRCGSTDQGLTAPATGCRVTPERGAEPGATGRPALQGAVRAYQLHATLRARVKPRGSCPMRVDSCGNVRERYTSPEGHSRLGGRCQGNVLLDRRAYSVKTYHVACAAR